MDARAFWLVDVDLEECRSVWNVEIASADTAWGMDESGDVLCYCEDELEARILAEEYANEERGCQEMTVDGKTIHCVVNA